MVPGGHTAAVPMERHTRLKLELTDGPRRRNRRSDLAVGSAPDYSGTLWSRRLPRTRRSTGASRTWSPGGGRDRACRVVDGRGGSGTGSVLTAGCALRAGHLCGVLEALPVLTQQNARARLRSSLASKVARPPSETTKRTFSTPWIAASSYAATSSGRLTRSERERVTRKDEPRQRQSR